MAERRMFAKTIIDSDAFIDMPLSTQALYFHLSMRADDEGFINNPRKIQRMVGASDDDMKVLLAKNFVIAFESGIIVIKHWKIHNYIRNDRLMETKYSEEKAMLTTKENGAYTFVDDLKEIEGLPAKEKRKIAYHESDLPYSFDYKIRNAFFKKPCPICGAEMMGTVDESGVTNEAHFPTIQHNKPISKGGKHELGNISVVCHQCNVSLKDKETGRLNADEVIEVWDCLTHDRQMSDKCQTSDGQVTDICQHRIDKDRIGKDRIKEERGSEEPQPVPKNPKKKFGEYKHVKLTENEFNRLCDDFGESLTQKAIDAVDKYVQETGKTYKDYNLTIRRWGIDAARKTNTSNMDDTLTEWIKTQERG